MDWVCDRVTWRKLEFFDKFTNPLNCTVEDLVEATSPLVDLAKVNQMKLIFEPGRSLVGNTAVLCAKVIGTKQSSSGKHFLVSDISMNECIRPCLYSTDKIRRNFIHFSSFFFFFYHFTTFFMYILRSAVYSAYHHVAIQTWYPEVFSLKWMLVLSVLKSSPKTSPPPANSPRTNKTHRLSLAFWKIFTFQNLDKLSK